MSTHTVWARLYRSGLRVLPPDLRAKHGASMEALFTRDMERAQEQERATQTAIAAIWDLLARGAYERVRSTLRGRPATTFGDQGKTFLNGRSPSETLLHLAKAYLQAFTFPTLFLASLSAFRQFQQGSHSASDLLQIGALSVPFTAVLTAPMAVFLAVATVLLDLVKRPAATVDSGNQKHSLLLPILGFASVMGIATLLLSAEVVPRANTRLASVMARRNAGQNDRLMTLGALESRHRELLTQMQQRRESLVREMAPAARAERIGPYEDEMRIDRRNFLAAEVRNAETLVAANAVEIHKKYALAVACVVLALAAVALAPRDSQNGTLQVVVSSIAVFGFYYICLMAGESLADQLLISPFQAMWAANEFVLIGSLLLVWHRFRGDRPRQPTEEPLTM